MNDDHDLGGAPVEQETSDARREVAGELLEVGPREVTWQTDWLLTSLVTLVTKVEGLGIGVTLTLPGGVISGTLVGVDTFFAEYGKYWEDAFKGDSTDLGKQMRLEYAAQGRQVAADIRSAPSEPPTFIHLTHARHLTAGGLYPSEGPGFSWRGRIAEVSGFSLGTFVPERR